MDQGKFKCRDCDNIYKIKYSLKRHINSCELNRVYVGGLYEIHKEYIMNIDFLKHRVKFHQPVIFQEGRDHISTTKPSTSLITTTTP